MKYRYLLFAWDEDSAHGGTQDLRGKYTTLEELIEGLKDVAFRYERTEVLDLELLETL